MVVSQPRCPAEDYRQADLPGFRKSPPTASLANGRLELADDLALASPTTLSYSLPDGPSGRDSALEALRGSAGRILDRRLFLTRETLLRALDLDRSDLPASISCATTLFTSTGRPFLYTFQISFHRTEDDMRRARRNLLVPIGLSPSPIPFSSSNSYNVSTAMMAGELGKDDTYQVSCCRPPSPCIPSRYIWSGKPRTVAPSSRQHSRPGPRSHYGLGEYLRRAQAFRCGISTPPARRLRLPASKL